MRALVRVKTASVLLVGIWGNISPERLLGSPERSRSLCYRLTRAVRPEGKEAPVKDYFAGSGPSNFGQTGWRLITGSGVGIGPTAFSVGCCSSGGLVFRADVVRRLISPRRPAEIWVKYPKNPRFCVCCSTRHDTGPAGGCVFFFRRVTGKGALG